MSTATINTLPFAVARKPWIDRAQELAQWAMARCVNRVDVFGGYLPMRYREPGKQPAVTKPPVKKRGQEFLSLETLVRHFKGAKPEHVIGTHSTSPECTCLGGGHDLDRHSDGPEQPTPEVLFAFAQHLYGKMVSIGFRPLLTDSNGKGGLHQRIFFTEPVESGPLYRFLQRSVDDHAQHGLTDRPETFPKQPELSESCKFGNWMRLPGRHHTRNQVSRVWGGERWLEGNEAIDVIMSMTGDSPSLLPFIEPPPLILPVLHEGNGHSHHVSPSELEWRLTRARAYLRSKPPGVAGQRLQYRTYNAACKLVKGFGLTVEQALPLLAEWNSLSRPPLSEADLRKKLECAAREPGPDGYLLNAEPLDLDRIIDGQSSGRGRSNRNDNRANEGSTATDKDGGNAPASLLTAQGQTDIANAARLVARFGDRLRYCALWKKWLVWDGKRWLLDDILMVDMLAHRIAKSLWDEVAKMYEQPATAERDEKIKWAIRWAKTTSSDKGIAAMLSRARSMSPVPVRPRDLDTHPWLLNCKNGTLDLRTGNLRPHDRADMLTKLCDVDYDPEAKCPLWVDSLNLILPQPGIVAYLQRFFGYALTGSVKEQIVPIFWGNGDNGKTTVYNAVLGLLGSDYAIKADKSLLIAQRFDKHSTERMDLHGKRFVVTAETEAGDRFAEAFLKELTGCERIRGRRMKQDTWEYEPTHKLLLSTNHKPLVRGRDHAFWRRPKLIEFMVKLTEAQKDRDLPDKLKLEYAGILAWLVRGCLEWQRNGLGEPPTVTEAVDKYREESNTFQLFHDECCEVSDKYKVKLEFLRKKYLAWCADRGDDPESGRVFGEWLQSKGYERKVSNGTWYLGLRLIE